jgi:hypothetical protein
MGKPDSPVWQTGLSGFCDFGFLLAFLLSWSLDAIQSIFLLQSTLDRQIFKFSSILDFAMKLPKPDVPEWQTG